MSAACPGLRARCLALALAVGLAPGVVLPATAGTLLPGRLVSPQWLEAHLNEVAVLDVRDDAAGFTQPPSVSIDPHSGAREVHAIGGHIPGALLIEFGALRAERMVDGRTIPYMLPDADRFQTLMRTAGLRQGQPVVIVVPATDPEELDEAARAYWSLKFYGSDEVAILDGGLLRWLAEGRPTETTPAKASHQPLGDWVAGPPRVQLRADSTQVANADRDGVQLLDARPAAFYFGLQKKPAVALAGHIGHALNFPSELYARPVAGSQRFLSVDQYRDILHAIGVDPQAPIIAYCNTGHLAAGAWFILSELLGEPHVALYDGSMLRWAAEGRPVVSVN